jgi:hypothetical protein
MLFDDIEKLHTQLLQTVLDCDESDYEEQDFRDLIDAAFDLSDFLIKYDAAVEYSHSDYESYKQSNVYTVKKLFEMVEHKAQDREWLPFNVNPRLPSRYRQAIEDTQTYLSEEGMFELIKGGWAQRVMDCK